MQTDENELLYMRARYYSTDLKRFINEDPEKDRVNWYIYGNSNPVNYIDPEGTIPILAIVGVGMWAHSAYSFYRAAKSGDRFGMLMSGIGLIPGGKLLSSAGRAMRGLSSGARVLGGRVGTSLARSLSGVVRSSSAKLSSVIKTASGSALRTAPKIRVAGNGSRASVQSRLGGLRPKGGTGGGNPQLLLPGNTINTPRLPAAPPKVNLNELPKNVQHSFNQYSQTGWRGSISGHTPGTRAGGVYRNANGTGYSHLSTHDHAGRRITYREFDVNNKVPNAGRDTERFVRGSDGTIYYTDSHYGDTISPTGIESIIEIIL